MGGAKAGERASRMAVETVAEMVLIAQHRDTQVLLSAVEEANRRVLEAAHSDTALEGMGTTLVAALEMDGQLSIASVGDSRAYLLDGDGFRVITDDQTWVNEVGRPLGLDEDSLQQSPDAPCADDGDWGQLAADRQLLLGAAEVGHRWC